MPRKSILIITLALLLTAYLGWLGYLGLRAEEPRRAVVSMEMMNNGDYLMPHLNGWPYYNKPPLFNWVMISFFKVTGSFSEWVVRLPSMLSLLLLAFINWHVARRFLHPRAALLSSLILLTSADILFYGSVNTGEIDLFLTLIVYLDLMAVFLFAEKGQFLRLFLLSYFFAALGFLTKGLPSLAYHGLTLLAALIWTGEYKRLLSWKHLAGILLFLAVAGGYMFLIYQRGELNGFLLRQVKESTQRTGMGSGIVGTLLGLVENPFTLMKLSLPWSLSLLGFLSGTLRRKVLKNKLVAFSLLLVAVNFPVYWITGELRERYVYPLIPFLSILYAALIHDGLLMNRRFRDAFRVGTPLLILLFTVALMVAFFIPSLKMALPNALLNGMLMAGGAALAIFTWKDRIPHVYAVVILMALMRITMNNIYFKLYDENSETARLKAHVSDMVDLTHGAPVSMTGSPYRYGTSFRILGREYHGKELVVPIVLSYQVPYYYGLETGNTITFVEKPVQGQYYLVREADIHSFPGKVLYSYPDYSTKNTWHLIQAAID